MGYDTKLYIGSKGTKLTCDDYIWFDVWATLDLCCLNHKSLILEKFQPHGNDRLDKDSWIKNEGYDKMFFYADDGNTEITEDKYEDPLYAIPLKDFLKVLKQEWEESKKDYTQEYGYRRLYWAKNLLTSMQRTQSEQLFVVMYGH